MKSTAKIQHPKLDEIVSDISYCPTINNVILIDILTNAGIKSEDFLQFNTFNHDSLKSYGRNKIFESRNFTIYLMSWAWGDFTAIHSHGLADWGAVCFLGDVNHRLYKTKHNKIELTEKGIIPQGAIVPVTGNLVHAMGNLNETPVMTLHIYGSNNLNSNANDNSVVYELEKNRMSTTAGSAFINMSDGFIKNTETGIETNTETITDYFEIISNFYQKNNITGMCKYIDTVLGNPEIYFKNSKSNKLILTS
jgi:predicted metal-dependent enzyme (double-stranded beta helix superfamily)